ncbi:hypothetical protein FOA52_010308 [Chlamydomonas sp. UWO 241]|nr:hypothetical protein FOA52_010308 [Chlamydomonas sp. UWO 241]
MVVATNHDKQPCALEAVFPGVSSTVFHIGHQFEAVVCAYRGSFLLIISELHLCAPDAADAAAAAVIDAAVIDAAVEDWRRLPQSVLPLLQELGRACVLLLPCVQQSADRSRAALELLPAIASLGAIALDSNIDAVKMPEYIRQLRDMCWLLEAKAGWAARNKAAEAEMARECSKKEIKKGERKVKACDPPTVMPLQDTIRLEDQTVLLQLQQYDNIGAAAVALNLVAQACAVVLAPLQPQQTRGPAALPLLLKLESTGVLELMARAGDWIWVLLQQAAPLLEPDAVRDATQPGCTSEDDVARAEQALRTWRTTPRNGQVMLSQHNATKVANTQRQQDAAPMRRAHTQAQRACGAATALMALVGGWLRAAHGLLSVAGAAVAEALAEAHAPAPADGVSGASAVVDAAAAAHRIAHALLEDWRTTGWSNGGKHTLADHFELIGSAKLATGSSTEQQQVVEEAVAGVTCRHTTLAVLCSPLAAKVMLLQPGVWQAAIDNATPAACKCTPAAATIICTTATASKLLAQLCMPPGERPAQMLPRLLARIKR